MSLTRILAIGFAMALIALPPLSLAAQIPFWFFRIFFGWQFVHNNRRPAQSYSLRDIFVVTFIFALSFAVPQIAINLQKSLDDNFDPTIEMVEVVQPDGSVILSEQKRTDEAEIRRLRQERESGMRLGTFRAYGGAAIYMFLITNFGFPVVVFVFLMKDIPYGCGGTALYGLGLLFCSLS